MAYNCTAPMVCIALEDYELFWALSVLVATCVLATFCKICCPTRPRRPMINHGTLPLSTERDQDEGQEGQEAQEAQGGQGGQEGQEGQEGQGDQDEAPSVEEKSEDLEEPPPYHRLV